MKKLTEEEADALVNEITAETIGEFINFLNTKMELMESKGLPPKYGVYLAKACGFALSSASLAFYDDKDHENAGKDMIVEFASHIGQTVSLNKGMAGTQKIILQ